LVKFVVAVFLGVAEAKGSLLVGVFISEKIFCNIYHISATNQVRRLMVDGSCKAISRSPNATMPKSQQLTIQ